MQTVYSNIKKDTREEFLGNFGQWIGDKWNNAMDWIEDTADDVFDSVLNWGENALANMNNLIQKTGGMLGKISEKVIDAGIKLEQKGISAVLAPLLPFKGAMKKKLQQIGVKNNGTIRDITEKFYANVIKKNSNFQHLDPATIAMMVPIILQFFAIMQENKKKQTASEEEKKMVSDANDGIDAFDVDKMIQEELDAQKNETSGGIFSGDNMMMIIILIAVAVIAIILLT